MSEVKRNVKLWASLGLAASVATAGAASAAAFKQPFKASHGTDIHLAAAAGEGGEGGEGEGGSAAKGADLPTYLTQLALIEGHMAAGLALYAKGDHAAAQTHMKHPGDELYSDLKPMLKAFKAKGFAKELEALAKAVGAHKPVAEVEAAQARLQKAIAAARPAELEAPAVALVVSNLLRTAAEEYAVGVKDGKVTDAHEYQDAWGFVQAARQHLKNLSASERQEHAKEIESLEKELAGLDSLWPDISGKTAPTRQPVELRAAAARVELIALSIK